MGIFDRFSTLLRSNINDLISSAEDPEKMLNADPRRHARPAREGEAAGRRRHRRREAAARPGRRRVQAGARTGSSARCSRSRKAATTSPSRRSSARASTASTASSSRPTWEAHRAETEKLKNSLRDLNDKIEEAKRKKNLLARPPASRAGAEAHRRDDVVAVREVARSRRSPGWKSASSRTSARSRRRPRSTRSSPATRCSSEFKQLEKGAVAVTRRHRSSSRSSRRWACSRPAARPEQGARRRRRRDEEEVHAEIEDDERKRRSRVDASTRPGGAIPVRPDSHGDGPHRPAAMAVREDVAHVFLLLFLAILISLYLGAVAEVLQRPLRLPARRRARRRGRCSRSAALVAARSGCSCRRSSSRRRSSSGRCRSTSQAWELAIDRLVAAFPALERRVRARASTSSSIAHLRRRSPASSATWCRRSFGIVHACDQHLLGRA